MHLKSTLFAGMLAMASAAFPAHADYRDDIGLTELQNRPGALLAAGDGIVVAQSEARDPNNGGSALVFAPNPSDPEFVGVSFDLENIPSTVSVHGTQMARAFYGRFSGTAPAVTQVRVFGDTGFLGLDPITSVQSPSVPVPSFSVVNSSWVGSLGASTDLEMVRRLDFLVREYNVVSVHSVDNSATDPFPELLASSYNGIAVGVSSGASSRGPTFFDSPFQGRAKPDLVAPTTFTSEASAVVSGAATLLLSEAKARSVKPGALGVKAILMASADPLPGYEHGGPMESDDQRVPLDYAQGAGELRINEAFDVLVAGRQTPKKRIARRGWDVNTVRRNKPVSYLLRFSRGTRDLRAMLTWNRHVSGDVGSFTDQVPQLANLDLIFQQKIGKKWELIARSRSTVDNVESIGLEDLAPGTYRMIVKGPATEKYGLAWDSDYSSPDIIGLAALNAPAADGGFQSRPSGSLLSVPEPAAALMIAPTAMFLLRRKRR